MWKLAVSNVIVIIGLLVCYVYLFGVISLKRYLEKDVIIISHEEDSGIIKPGEDFYFHLFRSFYQFILGILVVPINPPTGKGWKNISETEEFMCDGRNGNTYFDCIEENTFSASDILVSKKDYKFKPVYKENKLVELYNAASNQSIKIRSFYSNYVNALLHIHSLEVDSGVISTNLSTMDLYLNNSYSYFIILTDSKLSNDCKCKT